jgi:hypothetical protein
MRIVGASVTGDRQRDYRADDHTHKGSRAAL